MRRTTKREPIVKRTGRPVPWPEKPCRICHRRMIVVAGWGDAHPGCEEPGSVRAYIERAAA